MKTVWYFSRFMCVTLGLVVTPPALIRRWTLPAEHKSIITSPCVSQRWVIWFLAPPTDAYWTNHSPASYKCVCEICAVLVCWDCRGNPALLHLELDDRCSPQEEGTSLIIVTVWLLCGKFSLKGHNIRHTRTHLHWSLHCVVFPVEETAFHIWISHLNFTLENFQFPNPMPARVLSTRESERCHADLAVILCTVTCRPTYQHPLLLFPSLCTVCVGKHDVKAVTLLIPFSVWPVQGYMWTSLYSECFLFIILLTDKHPLTVSDV